MSKISWVKVREGGEGIILEEFINSSNRVRNAD